MDFSTVKLIASKGLILAEKYAPDMMTVGGVVAIGGGTVMACKATLKLPKILDEANTRLDKIDYHYNMINSAEHDISVSYDETEMKKDKLAVFADAGKKLVKIYGPAAVTLIAGITCVLGAHGVMKKRNAGLIMAYDGLQKVFDQYRERVVADAGKEKDIFYRTGYEQKDVKAFESSEDEEGKDIKKAKVVDPLDEHSEFARLFDESNPNWSKDAGYNLLFLRAKQEELNTTFHAQGYLFLNDVYEELGFKKTPAGQLVGWVDNDPTGTTKVVDFGIYDSLYQNDAKRDFVNAAERSVWLDFNVDGVVYNLI